VAQERLSDAKLAEEVANAIDSELAVAEDKGYTVIKIEMGLEAAKDISRRLRAMAALSGMLSG
jgi:hypothetical protein